MGDTESLTDRLIHYLSENNAHFTVMTHDAVATSEDAARVRGTPLEQGAKALLCAADGEIVLLVVPADRRLDSKLFKRAFGKKDIRMVPRETLFELTGLEPGAVPPFGHLMGFPTYADERLLELPQLSFNAGSRTTSVVLLTEDYDRLAHAQTARFASEASG